MKLFLFDIDGTLLTGDGVGRRAMDDALFQVTGHARATTGIAFGGATDRGIVRLALQALREPEQRIDEVLAAYAALMVRDVAFRALSGAPEVVRAMAAHGLVGLGTGNIESAAHHKVTAAGMGGLFGYGGYGSDAEVRSELLAVGALRGAALAGRTREQCEVIVIGDTPRDIEAARAIGARVVAVATGGVSLEALAEHQPDALLASLADLEHAVLTIRGD